MANEDLPQSLNSFSLMADELKNFCFNNDKFLLIRDTDYSKCFDFNTNEQKIDLDLSPLVSSKILKKIGF
jgi:hypothetical protein